jgi:hypothetical protein
LPPSGTPVAEVETTPTGSPGLSRSGPILVTGMQRSGTTWVGRMLSLRRDVTYLGEPLNPYIPGPLLSLGRKYQYTYICEENETEYLQAFEGLTSFRYPLAHEVRAAGSAANVLRVGKRAAVFTSARIRGARALVKDPFAFFSAPWLARRLGFRVVVLVRHPGAVADSMKRLGWSFDFRHLLDQPLLMQDLLAPWEDEMRDQSGSEDIVAQASLLWKIVYAIGAQFRSEHDTFVFVRHEDLAEAPVAGFASLYDELGLEFDSRVARTIDEFTDERNPPEQRSGEAKAVRLHSPAAAAGWRKRLSATERDKVRHITDGIVGLFYPEESLASREESG